MKIKFPVRANQRYYNVHYLYILNILSKRHDIEFVEGLDIDNLRFKCVFGQDDVIFDFADSSEDFRLDLKDKCKAYFKFHLKGGNHGKNIYPFSPVSFYQWDEYFKLCDSINYTCNSHKILNNQRPYAGALERRNLVGSMLAPLNADFEITDQETYWKKINDCMVGVFVPGQNNNMLDRGQLQFMGFGACTISPNLPEILPWNKPIINGVHYLRCNDDYSDLIEKVELCRHIKDVCVMIGKNAKNLFQSCCTESKLNDWIEECLR